MSECMCGEQGVPVRATKSVLLEDGSIFTVHQVPQYRCFSCHASWISAHHQQNLTAFIRQAAESGRREADFRAVFSSNGACFHISASD